MSNPFFDMSGLLSDTSNVDQIQPESALRSTIQALPPSAPPQLPQAQPALCPQPFQSTPRQLPTVPPDPTPIQTGHAVRALIRSLSPTLRMLQSQSALPSHTPSVSSYSAPSARPARPEPAQHQPSQFTPAHDQPVNAQPVHAQPAQAQLTQVQPVHAQPVHAQPVHAQPDYAQQVHAQQVHAQQVQGQLAHQQHFFIRRQMNNTLRLVPPHPAHAQPGIVPQGHSQTGHSQPGYAQSMDYSQSAFLSTGNAQPALLQAQWSLSSEEHHSLILQEQQLDDQINEITYHLMLCESQLGVFTEVINEYEFKACTNMAQHRQALQESNETSRGSLAEMKSCRRYRDWKVRAIEAIQIEEDLVNNRFALELLVDQMRRDVVILQNEKARLLQTMRREMAPV